MAHREAFYADIMYDVRRRANDLALPYNDNVINRGLIEIENKLVDIG